MNHLRHAKPNPLTYIFLLFLIIYGLGCTFGIIIQSKKELYYEIGSLKSTTREIGILSSLDFPFIMPGQTSGRFPATFGFENEEDGEEGTEIDFFTRYETDGSQAYAKIVNNVDGHFKVLKFYDGSTSGNYNFYAYHDFATKIPYGTIEFWVLNREYSGDQSGIYYHFANGSGATYTSIDTFNSLIVLMIDVNNDGLVRLHTGNGERTWNGIYSEDTWYHIRIDFECTNGGYLGLGQYELNFWFDGVQRLSGEPLRINDSLGVIASHSHGWDNTRHDYLDAVGFSWDPNYNVGDNLNEETFSNFGEIISIVIIVSLSGISVIIPAIIFIHRKRKNRDKTKTTEYMNGEPFK